MAPLTTTIQVDRSADDVFAYATDPTRFSEWQQGVTGGQVIKWTNEVVEPHPSVRQPRASYPETL
jgi:hypothetical protein